MATIDLATEYLGFKLSSPLVAAASPVGARLETMRRLEEAGIGAIVLPSLFEEQIEHDSVQVHALLETGRETFPEAASYFPELEDYNTGPSAYLRHVTQAKRALRVPVIASLNGTSCGFWVRYAKWIEEAGADALELNIYFVAADVNATGADIEKRCLDLVAAVRDATTLPLAVKIGPFFSSLVQMARGFARAGADGLVLFNRFLQPDIDLETLSVVPDLSLSSSAEVKLTLRWIAILAGRVPLSLAATGGAHSAEDVLKLTLAGADTVQMASALLKRGFEHVGKLNDDVGRWLAEREYASLAQAKGSLSQRSCPDPAAYERTQYMKALVVHASRYPDDRRRRTE